MNNKKVAFVLCTNEERQLNECLGYLDRLIIPDGYEKDVIAISEAPSMAGGYNAGMHSTDAKYKVYLHQDTFIINPNFISDMLRIFEDEKVGLLGAVGTRKMPRDAYAVTAWDTGIVYHNGDGLMIRGYQDEKRIYTEVEAVDGLLLATQYDIEFREDLFSDWDFYDISACYEFRRAGYKVVVPYQKECWVYHDDKFSKMLKYDKNRAIFAKEYSCDFEVDEVIKPESVEELEKIKFEAIDYLSNLIDEGRIKEVCEVLLRNDDFNFNCLRDIRILAVIYENSSTNTIFDWSRDAQTLFDRLNDLKWFLKRVEYNIDMQEEEYRFFVDNYGLQAVIQVCGYYCVKKKTVIKKLERYIANERIVSLLEQRLTDDVDFIGLIKAKQRDGIYNEAQIKNRNTLVIVATSSNDARVKKYFDIMCRDNMKEDVIVFSREEDGYIKAFVENNVPVVTIKATSMSTAAVMLYMMECEWKAKLVIYIGDGDYAKSVCRSLVNTPIKEQYFL